MEKNPNKQVQWEGNKQVKQQVLSNQHTDLQQALLSKVQITQSVFCLVQFLGNQHMEH
jgi:hypothetical protein